MKNKNKLFLLLIIFLLTIFIFPRQSLSAKNFAGRIFIQVEAHGEAWYVNPENQSRYYLGRPDDAFRIMRELSLGINNADLERLFGKMSGAKNYDTLDKNLANRLAGKILLQVEGHGEAYYINPNDLIGYYLGSPKDAFRVMQLLGTGIKNDDLSSIPVAEIFEKNSPAVTFEEEPKVPSDANTEQETEENEKTAKDSLGYHPIIFALNKGYADKLPDWKKRADQFIERINAIFLKTTSENFKITKYLVYDDNEYAKLLSEPEKYKEFYQHSEGGGFTYILLAHKLDLSSQDLAERYGTSYIRDAARLITIDKKKYYAVAGKNFEEVNVLTNPTAVNNLSSSAHEIGHLYGIGVPDWYMYFYSDCTGASPLFKDYDIKNDPYFTNDPMISSGVRLENIKFNELNSAIINKDSRLNFSSKLGWYSHNVKARILNKDGAPVSDAVVKTFCAKTICYTNCLDKCEGVKYGHGVPDHPEAEQVLTTDKNGYAEFKAPLLGAENGDNDNCIAKAVKAYYGDKSGVGVVNFIDLQKNYVLNNSDEYIVNIVL